MSKKMLVSGPMFEPPETETFSAQPCLKCGEQKSGAHYNLFQIKGGMSSLRAIFQDGVADELNLVAFSTSGVHGTYTTIEEIEHTISKYGPNADFGNEEWPDDFHGYDLTVLIIHPRICCLRYGNIKVQSLEDVSFLKRLRESSVAAFAKIGRVEDGT